MGWLAQQTGPLALGHEHGEVEEGADVEDAEHGRFGNESGFVTKPGLN